MCVYIYICVYIYMHIYVYYIHRLPLQRPSTERVNPQRLLRFSVERRRELVLNICIP